MARKKHIRFDTDVPDAECHACPFSCCSHPFQEIFSESYLTAYAKLCIKDLAAHNRHKLLARTENRGCTEMYKRMKKAQ